MSFGGTNGSHPYGALAQDAQGNLYGTTSGGGPFNAGTVFTFGTNNNGRTIRGNPSGAGPQAGLVLGLDGNLYGTTAGGGTNDSGTGGDGTMFQISPSGSFTNLFSFGGTNGSHPFAALLQGADRNLYGTTTTGGNRGAGTVFSITPAGAITVLYSFSGGNDGGNPYYASVTIGTNGNLYGTTSACGRGAHGTLYQISGLVPFVITTPTNETLPAGTTVSLALTAGGSMPLSYQWQVNSNNLSNGGNISGATSPVLTISNATTANSGNYSVVVHNSSGSITSAAVLLTVVDPYGTNRPMVKITSPEQNAFLNKSVITVKGSTSGTVPVSQLFYQLNGAQWVLASSTSGWATWSASVIVPTGTNVVQAYALNIVGTPSLTNSVTFVSGITSAPVSVRVEGSGSVSPNYDGQWLEIGRAYKMTAKPKAGFLFANWMEALADEPLDVISSPRLSFTMQSNLVLQANFVPNPFIPVSGTYNGLFYETNGIALESSGYITVKVSTKGSFSGALETWGTHLALHGVFDPEGHNRVTINAGNLANTVVSLQLDLTDGTDQITGTVSNNAWMAELMAERAVFDGKENVATQAGSYTLIVPGNIGNSPEGDGYGTIRVDRAGKVHFAGSLADGTKISQSATLTKEGQWPLYVSLYGGQGSILGWISLGGEEDLAGTLNWIKKSMPAKFYPAGFTNQFNTIGSRYEEPDQGMNILPFANGTLLLSGGNPGTRLTAEFTIGPDNIVQGVNGSEVKLKFTAGTGLFRGSTIKPVTSEIFKFSGVVLQNENIGRGYFLGSDRSGEVELIPR